MSRKDSTDKVTVVYGISKTIRLVLFESRLVTRQAASFLRKHVYRYQSFPKITSIKHGSDIHEWILEQSFQYPKHHFFKLSLYYHQTEGQHDIMNWKADIVIAVFGNHDDSSFDKYFVSFEKL